MMRSYYEVLGVSQGATSQEIKRAYFALAKKYHPDTSTLGSAEAQSKMAELNVAYAALSSADTRAAYDSRSSYNFMYADPEHPYANPAYHLANLNVQKRCREALVKLQVLRSSRAATSALAELWQQLREDVEYTFSRLQEVGVVEPETQALYEQACLTFTRLCHRSRE